jgi:hypothetical protein
VDSVAAPRVDRQAAFCSAISTQTRCMVSLGFDDRLVAGRH